MYKERGEGTVSIRGRMQTRFSHPFAVIPLPGVLFVTDTSSEAHLPGQRDSRHDHVDTLASDNLGSRETEDCANPGDRVHVHQPRALEISDTACSFQSHSEDDFSPTPSWLDEIVATQRLVLEALEALVLDTLVTTVSAVTVEAQATAKRLPDIDYNGIEIFLVVVDVEACASEAFKTVPPTSEEGTSASCSEIWEGKSGAMEREQYLFLFIIDTALHTVL